MASHHSDIPRRRQAQTDKNLLFDPGSPDVRCAGAQITQAVFIILARKADKLSQNAPRTREP